MANNVDPDEMASNGLSHLDLHCLQRYLCGSVGMKRLKYISNITVCFKIYHSGSTFSGKSQVR